MKRIGAMTIRDIRQRIRHGRPVYDVARDIHARVRRQFANAGPFARRRHHRVLAAALSRPPAHAGTPGTLQRSLTHLVGTAFWPIAPAILHIMPVIPLGGVDPDTSNTFTDLWPLSKRISTASWSGAPPRQIRYLGHTPLLPKSQLCPPMPPSLTSDHHRHNPLEPVNPQLPVT